MRSPKTLTLRARVFLTLVPIIALVVGLGVAGTFLIQHLGGRADAILHENYASVGAMERLDEAVDRIDSSFQSALLGETAVAARQYDASWAAMRDASRLERANATLPGERDAVERLTALARRLRIQGDAFNARAADDPQRRRDYFGRGGLLEVLDAIKSVTAEIRQLNESNMVAASRQAKATAESSVDGLLVAVGAVIALGALLVWSTSRALVAPIKALTKSMVGISEGDLEQRVRYAPHDELGALARAFNHMADRLRLSRRALDVQAEDLRRTEDKYRSIFENAVEGIFQSTPAGRYVTVNRAFAEMLGYASGQELIATVQHIGEQIYADPHRRIELARLLIHEGVVRDFEALSVRKDGRRVWLSFNMRTVRGKDGAVQYYEGFVSDVTARKQAEEARVASEANLSRAQEIAHLGSWHLDVATNRFDCSDEVFRIFGVPFGTPLTYEAFLAVVHPGDRDRVDREWTAMVRGAPPEDVEHRIIDGRGRLKWVRQRAEVRFDAGGKAIDGIGTVQDVTEQRLAEDRLRRLNRAHRALSGCNHAMVRASDEHAWMAEVCRLIVDEAGYRLCWVGLAEHDEARTVRPIAHAGFDEGYLAGISVSWADTAQGRGPTGTAIRTGRVVVTKNVAEDPSIAPWRAEALRRGYASTIAIPIVTNGQPFGSLNIYAAEPDAFTDAEVFLLTELVEDLAYGITALRTRADRDQALADLRALNTELELRVARRTADLHEAHDREARIGARIQQELLLDEPPGELPGVRLAALTVPSQRISGDFYGFFRHEAADCVDVLVADVMGKGVPAALLGAATKSQFPAALWHLIGSPDGCVLPKPRDIVTLAHTQVARQLIDIEAFVTLCYARIDTARHRLDLVDCGHTGVLHVHRGTGRHDLLHGDNLPLGIREGEIYGQISVPLEAEDLLVFFSDGVTEARNASAEMFGVERLVDCVREHVASEPMALVAAIRDAVVAFSGGGMLADDLTCVVAKLVPYETPLARATFEIGSALGELRRARELVESFCRSLADHALIEDRLASLVLAVNEATSNIMKHAYGGREDQRIDLTAEAYRDRVSIRLRYLGLPFDPSQIPAPAFDGSRDSGFGVFMIEQSVDAVRYYRDDLGRSCILLEKKCPLG